MDREQPTRPNVKKQRRPLLSVCFVLFLMMVVLGGATVFLWMSLPSHNRKREASVALFGVQSVTVSGETRYDSEAIIQASGIRKGQSIFSLNKTKAHDAVLASFPYLETVEIFNDTLNTVEIRVTETKALGAMYFKGNWLVVGRNGKGLELLPLRSNTPPRYLYLKGVTPPEGAGVGANSLPDRCREIVDILQTAWETYQFTGVSEVDLSDLTNVRLRLNNRIMVKLGNTTQLNNQMAVLADSLKYVYESYGRRAEGVLDLSSYANEDATDMVVFTPLDTLKKTEQAAGTAAASADTAGASGGTTRSAGTAGASSQTGKTTATAAKTSRTTGDARTTGKTSRTKTSRTTGRTSRTSRATGSSARTSRISSKRTSVAVR